MAQRVAKVGIKKEKGWLYFVDKNGDISRAKMARGGRKKKKTTKRKVVKKRKPAKKKKPAKRKPALKKKAVKRRKR